MSFLKLSWCKLIKIILSQIGGNPLQQVYSQLNQGLPTMAPASGIIPRALTEVKQLVDQVTAAVQTAQSAANDFTNVVDNIANQIFQNPVGTVIGQTLTAANSRITSIDTLLGSETDSTIIANLQLEKDTLANTVSYLQVFKTNTDRLSGVGGGATGGKGSEGCSLQDLLGSGCASNNDVPDVDLQALVDSLKQGDAITAIKEKIINASGVADLQQSLSTFNTTISGFNASFTATLDRAAIKNAVSGQLTQIVYNLLSGCGGQVLDLTLKPDVKNKLASYTQLLQLQQSGEVTLDAYGNVITNTSSIVVGSNAAVTVNLNFDRD